MRNMIHKPVLGRIQLTAMRTGMRVVNAVPVLKRRVTESVKRSRAADNLDEDSNFAKLHA